MTECDALKLIDEFIKRSVVPINHHHDLYQYYSQETPKLGARDTFLSGMPNLYDMQPHHAHRGHHSDVSETSFDSSYHSNTQSSGPLSIEKSQNSPNVLEPVQIETPPQSPPDEYLNGIPSIGYVCLNQDTDEHHVSGFQQVDEHPMSPPMKPTRPYSYYVATNFHPFDLSILCQQLEEKHQEEQEQEKAKSPVREVVRETPVRSSKRDRKQQQQKRQKQRLSVSLGDIKASNHSKLVVNDDDEDVEESFKLKAEKKSKSNQLVNKDEFGIKPSESKSGAFKRATGLTSTMPAGTARAHKISRAHHQPITGKINRFFRQLFRVGGTSDKKVPSTIDEEDVFEPEPENGFKFARLFSSIRGSRSNLNSSGGRAVGARPQADSNTLKHKYTLATRTFTTINSVSTADSTTTAASSGPEKPQSVLVDNQPAQLPHIDIAKQSEIESPNRLPASVSSSSPSYAQFKTEFYTEISERLKNLAVVSNPGELSSSSAAQSQEGGKSSMSSIDLIDIPYIDDDEAAATASLVVSTTSSTSAVDLSAPDDRKSSPNQLKIDCSSNSTNTSASFMSEFTFDVKKLNDLIANPTYERFDQLTNSTSMDGVAVKHAVIGPDSVWNRVAVMLELTNRVVHEILAADDRNFAEGKHLRVHRLKETAANYIHDKYCDWVYENGGWKSVPDSLSIPSYNNERIH